MIGLLVVIAIMGESVPGWAGFGRCGKDGGVAERRFIREPG